MNYYSNSIENNIIKTCYCIKYKLKQMIIMIQRITFQYSDYTSQFCNGKKHYVFR